MKVYIVTNKRSMYDFKLRPKTNKKRDLEAFIFEKVTELVGGIDSNRTFINEKLIFNESIGGFNKDIPEDGDQVNNVTVEIEMNEVGRLKKIEFVMGFDYDEI